MTRAGVMLPTWLAFRRTARIFASQRRLWLPFLVAAIVQAILILMVWLAAHPPFSNLLAPPIRYFFSERVLHYPAHLWFMYHVMKHSQFIATTLIGAYMTGIACVMVSQPYLMERMSLRDALVSRRVHFIRVAALWLITWGVAQGVGEAFGKLAAPSPATFWAGLGCLFLIQALLIYAIPASVFNRVSWWRAIWHSIRETVRHPLSTFIVVGIPIAALTAYAVFFSPARIALLMRQHAPEIVLPFIVLRLTVWTAVDAVLTVAVAHLWWIRRTVKALPPVAQEGSRVKPHHEESTRPLAGVAAPLIMVALIGVLTLTGCSESYSGERLFWQAQQVSAPIAEDPDAATPEQFDDARARYQEVINKSSGTTWAARSQVAIGSLYAVQRRFEKAREAYKLVLTNYHNYTDLALEARVGTARTLEAENKWDEAVKAYNELYEFHRWHRLGLEVPLYLAAGYQAQGQTDQARSALERALRLYSKMIPEAPTPELKVRVKGYIAQANMGLGQWQDAVTMFEEILKEPEGANKPLTFMMLGAIYEQKLNDPAKAVAVYEQLIAETTDEHPLRKPALQRLEALQGGGQPPALQEEPVAAPEPPSAAPATPVTP